MAAYAPTNRGEGVRDPGVTIGLLVPPLCDERNIAACLGMNRAGLHAGEVGLEPLEVDEFGSAAHETCPESLSRLLLHGQLDSCCRAAHIDRLCRRLAVFAPSL